MSKQTKRQELARKRAWVMFQAKGFGGNLTQALSQFIDALPPYSLERMMMVAKLNELKRELAAIQMTVLCHVNIQYEHLTKTHPDYKKKE